jgi:hypothetical protein
MKRLGRPLLALPAYQAIPAIADAPPTFTEVGVRYTHYAEDSIDQDAVIFGATDRYDIDITQLWIEAPVGASWSVALDVQNDYQTWGVALVRGRPRKRGARGHHERRQHSG